MDIFVKILCFAAIAAVPYLLCGINSAIIVTKIKTGKDIRTMGSGNAGLTNTLRTQGKLAALFVLLGDILKGVLSILAVHFVFKVIGVDTYSYTNGWSWVNYCAGIFAVVGHIFPVWYGFKGGKGILVTFAVMLTIQPVPALLLLALFGVVVAITRYVSLGSIVAATAYPFAVLIFSLFVCGDVCAVADFLLAAVIAFMLVFMHRANIRRLREHTEKKLGEKSK